MGGLDGQLWPPAMRGHGLHTKAPMTLKPSGVATSANEVPEADIGRVRRIFDDDLVGRPHCSINTPREDAKQFRSGDKHGVVCEGIVELYELLWRWGHRADGCSSFVKNFGFALPDTIIVVKGKPYAWYFISKKDGRLLRKSGQHLSALAIERKLCRDGMEGQVCGVWLPAASQFPEARCHDPTVQFMSDGGLGGLLGSLRPSHNGVIQTFVEPPGISNHLARTVTYRQRTSMQVRTNRSVLNSASRNMFDRAATFEGWEGLSASSSHYVSHKHPHMEELILAVGENLNRRIEEENMRQMLFLADDQHVALHFKVAKDGTLFFIFGSVVSEREVILQTREKLIMGDRVMTEELPGARLLRGGARAQHIPYEVRHDMSRWYPSQRSEESSYGCDFSEETLLAEVLAEEMDLPGAGPPAGGLPPIPTLRQQPLLGQEQPPPPPGPFSARGRAPPEEGAPRRGGPLSARASSLGRRTGSELPSGTLPRMAYPHPALPEAPFRVHNVGDQNLETRRYETIAAQAIMTHGQLKRRLISPTGTSDPAPARSGGRYDPSREEETPVQQDYDIDDNLS